MNKSLNMLLKPSGIMGLLKLRLGVLFLATKVSFGSPVGCRTISEGDTCNL